MRVLVTGAAGFLGQAVVRAAINAGHQPLAMVRPATDVSLLGWPEIVDVLRGDLRQKNYWAGELAGVEAVVHLAAATEGDIATQLSGTVVATENLLDALRLTRLRRFVHVSSFSVYDFSAATGSLVEESALVSPERARDAYTIAKTVQERLVATTCHTSGTHNIILRPGLIYGPGKDWNFGRSARRGRFDLIFSPRGRMPVTFVDNCADATICALEADVPSPTVCNIIDDDLPTFREYYRLCRSEGVPLGIEMPVPWWALRTVGLVAGTVDRVCFSGKARMPDMLSRTRQDARWRPLNYPNARARKLLGWEPRVGLREAVRRMVEAPGARDDASSPKGLVSDEVAA